MREAPLWRVTQGISQILVTLSSENQHLTSHLELLPWDSDLTLDPQPHLGDRCQAAVNMEICSPFCHVDQRWHRRGRFSRWKSGSNISSLSHLGEQMGKHVEELWASLKKKGGGGAFFPKKVAREHFYSVVLKAFWASRHFVNGAFLQMRRWRAGGEAGRALREHLQCQAPHMICGSLFTTASRGKQFSSRLQSQGWLQRGRERMYLSPNNSILGFSFPVEPGFIHMLLC